MVRRQTLLVAAGLAAACGTGPEPLSRTAPRFADPVTIGSPVSTTGWEDSGQISPDGRTLTFTYLRIDPIVFLQQGLIRIIGPLRPGWPTTPPFDTLGAELYQTTFQGGRWSEPANLGPPVNLPQGVEGSHWISEDGNRILFSDGSPSLPDRPIQGIYYAERGPGGWQKPVPAVDVGFPFVAHDENPHLTRDEQTLFFESSRPGGLGQQDIWMATRTGGRWSAPVNLGPEINTPGVNGSPFSLDGSELFWDDKGDGQGISWAYRSLDGRWAGRTIVMAGSVGDPSTTEAGDLYFIKGEVYPDRFDANIMVARRRP